jgi:hypothetical protein
LHHTGAMTAGNIGNVEFDHELLLRTAIDAALDSALEFVNARQT